MFGHIRLTGYYTTGHYLNLIRGTVYLTYLQQMLRYRVDRSVSPLIDQTKLQQQFIRLLSTNFQRSCISQTFIKMRKNRVCRFTIHTQKKAGDPSVTGPLVFQRARSQTLVGSFILCSIAPTRCIRPWQLIFLSAVLSDARKLLFMIEQ